MKQTGKNNRWKIAFGICLVFLLLTGTAGFYAIVDHGIILTYLRESHQDTEEDLKTVVKLINETDLSKGEIKAHLQNHRLQEHMNFESDAVSLERIQLKFKDGRLVEIGIE